MRCYYSWCHVELGNLRNCRKLRRMQSSYILPCADQLTRYGKCLFILNVFLFWTLSSEIFTWKIRRPTWLSKINYGGFLTKSYDPEKYYVELAILLLQSDLENTQSYLNSNFAKNVRDDVIEKIHEKIK